MMFSSPYFDPPVWCVWFTEATREWAPSCHKPLPRITVTTVGREMLAFFFKFILTLSCGRNEAIILVFHS